MNRTTTQYAANDLAEDLGNLGEEILADALDTLGSVSAATYDGSEWECLRKAVGEMRQRLDELEKALDAKQIEADEYDPEADEPESRWM